MAEPSSKSLIEKLGIKTGQLVYFKNVPEEYFKLLGKLPNSVFIAKKLNRPVDFMHCFYTEQSSLKKDTIHFKQYLEQNGSLWISWPKKSDLKNNHIKTDITDQSLRDILLPLNLVDIKVISVNKTWSGLKFVWRIT